MGVSMNIGTIDIWSTVILIICCLCTNAGSMFSMLTKGQLYVLTAGDATDLDCEFNSTGFHLFNNPVLWKKTQFTEETRINIMSNINEPFSSTERFKVTFLPYEPRYRMVLTIVELTLGDSGNYTCEVRNPDGEILATMTHRIFVRAQVEHMVLTKSNKTNQSPSRSKNPPTVDFTNRIASAFQCIAVGGNPPPDIKLSLSNHSDIDYLFQDEAVTTLEGVVGLKTLHSRVHKWTNDLVVTSSDDGKLLTCTVSVPGLPPMSAMSVIRVKYAPVIKCKTSLAYLGARNVHVSCNVRAQPSVSALLWIIDENGTTVTQGKIVDEYWMLFLDQPDGTIETNLYMRKADDISKFRTYMLVAENVVGVSKADVEILQKHRPPTHPPPVRKKKPHDYYNDYYYSHRRRNYIFIKDYAVRPATSLSLVIMLFIAQFIVGLCIT